MSLTLRLRGKVVEDVTTNGHVLRITTSDGASVDVVWLDDQGKPMKGKPAAMQHGPRLIARGMEDLICYPGLRTKGQA